MACFHPITAYQPDGGGSLVFVDRGGRQVVIPCGQCIGCRLERARQWSVRVMHEAACHADNSFVTLTYDDDHVPYGGTLHYPHVQKFLRAVRRSGRPFRFYVVGEYGPLFGRPHYHLCMFGLGWRDGRVPVSKGESGELCYATPELSSFWPHGFASVGELTAQSAMYIAKYCLKKTTGKASVAAYERLVPDTGEVISLVPEFSRMSLKPGIGGSWFDKFGSDVFPHDHVIVNGVKQRPPRYYSRLFSSSSSLSATLELEVSRYIASVACQEDSTPDRLAVREVVTHARLNRFSRNLE